MSRPPAIGRSGVGGVELLERAVGYALGSLHLVTAEVLGWPTPCADWNLQQLLQHVNDSLLALHEALDVGYVDARPVERDPCPVGVLQDGATRLIGALSGSDGRPVVSIAGCPMTTTLVTAAGALELAVHGWDIARACGSPRPIPDGLATELVRLTPMLITDADRPGRFAAPVAVPATATAGDRLLGFVGRTP